MSFIQPFAALRPTAEYAAAVAAPPYDVLSTAEARQLVAGRPWSFLHISRAEVDLPATTDPYAPEVYAQARANLERMLAAGVLVRDSEPGYSVYRLTWGRMFKPDAWWPPQLLRMTPDGSKTRIDPPDKRS